MVFHSDERSPGGGSQNRGQRAATSSRKSTTILKCSLCGKSFDRAESTSLPFCSNRCRQIDLGNWLNESYGLPMESDSSLPDEEEQDE